MNLRLAGNRWGENEIDLVCENEFKGTLDFEIKCDARRYAPAELAAKGEAFFHKNPGKRKLRVTFGALSLADIRGTWRCMEKGR